MGTISTDKEGQIGSRMKMCHVVISLSRSVVNYDGNPLVAVGKVGWQERY